MTTETRRITFSTELVQAITRHRRDEKQPLPESRIRGTKVESGEGPVPRVTLLLDPAGGDGSTAMDFRATEIAVALIKFCRLKRIPLPKRAEKSLGVDHGQISLCCASAITERVTAPASRSRAAGWSAAPSLPE